MGLKELDQKNENVPSKKSAKDWVSDNIDSSAIVWVSDSYWKRKERSPKWKQNHEMIHTFGRAVFKKFSWESIYFHGTTHHIHITTSSILISILHINCIFSSSCRSWFFRHAFFFFNKTNVFQGIRGREKRIMANLLSVVVAFWHDTSLLLFQDIQESSSSSRARKVIIWSFLLPFLLRKGRAKTFWPTMRCTDKRCDAICRVVKMTKQIRLDHGVTSGFQQGERLGDHWNTIGIIQVHKQIF